MDARGRRVMAALFALNFVASGMLFVRHLAFGGWNYSFLNWNLFLAWLPLIFSTILLRYTRRNPWVSPAGLAWTVVWLGFLPNSFYLVTDFMHLQGSTARTLLFDVVLLLLFTLAGLVVGFVSVYQVHRLLLLRINSASASRVVAGVFFACSFAIYLGRFLRWNTWDVVTNPAGIILDVTDRIFDPGAHQQTFWITILFFAMLTTLYFVAWEFAKALQSSKSK